jgi:hypothetical protein
LCTLHHRVFDRGVVGLADDGTVMASQLFVGRAQAARAQVLSLAGAPLLPPARYKAGPPPPTEEGPHGYRSGPNVGRGRCGTVSPCWSAHASARRV